MSSEEALIKVCKDLNIEFDKGDMQDWGIVNSDPSRVAEFIEYYKNAELADSARAHVFELVVASYNDAMLHRPVRPQIKSDFIKLIKESYAIPATKAISEYWIEIYDRKDFPIGKLISEIKA